jgi:phosphonate transport system substrate-binding protein
MHSLLYLILSFFLTVSLFAKEYPHSLDTRYHDRNGDLIADTPKEPSKWIDPPTLVFSYAPHEDPNIYQKDWKDFLTYLAKVTGKKVVYFPYQTNTAQLEAMRYGRLHISGFNTGLVPAAVNYAGFHPVAMMADSNGDYGYTMEIITYPGSGISHIQDLAGEKLTLTAPSSNSGAKAPIVLLARYFHLQPQEDYRIGYSGSHAKSIMGVAARRFKIAAVASSVKQRMIDRGEIKAEALRVLYRSGRFPTTAYGYLYNLKPSLAQKIQKAFFTFPWFKADGTPTSLKAEFRRQDRFIPVDYKQMWHEIREIQKPVYPDVSKK